MKADWQEKSCTANVRRVMVAYAMRWVAVVMLGFVAILAGCPPSEMDLGYDDASIPADAGADVDEMCPPDRYVTRTQLWDGPYWLWVGPAGQEPDCPSETGGEAGDWHADPVPSLECPCDCGPSTGSCELPLSFTAHDVLCQDVGQMHNDTPFDAPASWDGKCDGSTKVPAGAAQSVTIAPLTIKKESCESGPPMPPMPPKEAPDFLHLPYRWTWIARTCHGWGWSWSQNPETICIPSDQPTPKGFLLCEMQLGKTSCDDKAWPNNIIFYRDVDDQRRCDTCTCGPPVGSQCSASISVYKDGADMCASPPLLTLTVESDTPKCGDTPIDTALGSKSAGTVTYIPGTCQPSQVTATGTVNEVDPVTFCCQP